MGLHLVTTKIKLSQCNRCSSYVWTCEVNGCRTMVDPSPLGDLTEYVAALGDGREVYAWAQGPAGRPETLRPVSRSTPIAEGLARGRLVASHPCGTGARNSTRVETTEVVLPKASVSTAAVIATAVRHRFKPAICTTCRVWFLPDENYYGIYISSSQWQAWHADGCPPPKDRARLRRERE